MTQTILKMEKINKSFNDVVVLNDVDFELKKGEVHALMGGNGAGKSTLMKILTGVYTANSGNILINGDPVRIEKPQDAQNAAIAMIFQEFSVIPTMSISENMFLNREELKKTGFINQKRLNEQTKELLRELNIKVDPNTKLEELSVGYWQMTEICKALSQDAKILIMDEPTATLTKKETTVLFQLIKKLKSKGISIIYISHRMDEIYKVSDRITVLRDGKHVITSPVDDLPMKSLVSHIVGQDMGDSFQWKERKNPFLDESNPVFEVQDLHSGSKVNGLSFKLFKGEILGIAGLMGSGRTEMSKAVFGIDKIDTGTIKVNGKPIKISNPQDAMNEGIALVPEDRRVQGLVLEHSLRENIMLPILNKVSKLSVIKNKSVNDVSERFIKKLNVKTDDIYKTMNLLSGGNQQKIVLSKWLANDPDILILDEPTNGVDIGAKSEIIEIIKELADQGKSVIVISSELSELLAVVDRILIFKEGKVDREIYRKDIVQEEDLEHAIQNEN
ncbi:ribose transport system ATP-binding protein [Gracilibacillus halotolerans]|uniref:Ribose transport system ATP-binding protein n=1 Tax=Gracilibacillus halotolerans TaxID=74386 RepID=A0A841RN54_9BACI|nr:ribose transport system ATP-binding protein [Gracilibacillus halotolerans]